jgi:GT2 family glycosyltransferase
VDVLIPVYNRLDQLRLLVGDIEREQDAGEVAPEIRFHVLDDASGSRTASALGPLAARIGARLTRREKNLGFLRNVNQAYAESDAEIAILLNSDIRLPPAFFSRLLGHVVGVPDAAVVTVVSFSEIASRVSQMAGASWREVDLDLQATAADSFMQACTSIGYCMVVNRQLVPPPLMDEAFGHGYGEDSDLHYRVIAMGLRSLLYLGMCISHESGSSYALRADAAIEFAAGRRLFWSRWGFRYVAEFPAFDRSYSQFLKGIFPVRPSRPPGPAVVFVVPGVDERIGGSQVVARAAKKLASQGVFTRLVSLSGGGELILDGLTSIGPEDVGPLQLSARDLVLLAGNASLEWWTIRVASGACPIPGGVLQGFDHLLDPRFAGPIETFIARSQVIFSASPFLDQMAADLRAQVVRPFAPELGGASSGPDPAPWSARDIDVLIPLSNVHTKGWWFGATLANLLGRRGIRVAVFGAPELVEAHVDRGALRMGRLARSELLALFGRTRVFVDPTMAEGYGLMPREAILLGAHAFYGEGGGNDPGTLAAHATSFHRYFDVYSLANDVVARLRAGTPCSIGQGCAICDLTPDVEVDPSRPTLDEAVIAQLMRP